MSQRRPALKWLLVPALSIPLVLASVAVPRAAAIDVVYAEAGSAAIPFLNGKLVVTSISPASPTATSTFSVTVQSQTNGGVPTPVAGNVGVRLSRSAGSGTLGPPAALDGTIIAGTNTITFTGLTYTTAESGVRITAAQTSGTPGDSLSAGQSAAFTVQPGPAVALDINANGVNGGANPTAGPPSSFSVIVTAEDTLGNASDVTQATGVVLTLAGGNGTLAGTLTGTITSGRTVTISGVTYTKAESGVSIRATRTSGDSLSSGASPAFTVNAGAVTKLAVTTVNGGVNPTAGTAFSVIVQSQDANGNAQSVGGTATGVLLSKATGTGTLSGTLTGTIPSGGSSVTISGVTYTTSESGVSIRAARNLTGPALSSGTSAPFTVDPGAATNIIFTAQPPTNVVSMIPINTPTGVKVSVRDANNNVVTTDNTRTVTVAIGTNPSAGTLGGTKTVTVVNGVATFTTLTIDKIGSGYTLTATSSPALTTPTSSAFNITPGAVNKLAITSVNGGSNPTAGTGFSVVVTAQDAGGNTQNVTANTGVALTVGTGTPAALGGTVTGTIPSGGSAVTIIGVTYTKAESATLVASTTSGPSLAAGTSASFTVNAAIVNKLAVTSVNSGADPVAGTAFAIVVQSQDQYGNAAGVTGTTTVVMTAGTGTGTLGGTLTGSIGSGQSTATGLTALTYNKAEGGVSLTATRQSGGSVISPGTSGLFTVDPGAASVLAFSAQPTTTQSATAINGGTGGIKVEIRDSLGNVTTDARDVTLAIGTNPGSGTLTGTVTVAAVAGVATFSNVKIDKIGTGYTLTASSSPALTTPTSSSFNITIGPLTQLGITAVNGGSNPTAGVGFPVIVQSQDAGGNPVNVAGNTGVTLTAPGFTGTLGGTTSGTILIAASSTTISGVTYTKAETLTLTASGGALTPGTSALFTVNPNTANRLVVTSVNGGGNPVAGTTFSIVVQSQDSFGNAAPVTSSTDVQLARAAGTGTLGPAPALAGTIPNGGTAVTYSGLTYTKAEGGVTVTATQQSGSPALIAGTSGAFTVVPGAATQVVFSAQPTTTQSATAINSGTGGIKIELRDANDNVVTSEARGVTLAIGTNPGGGTLSGTTTVSAVAGVATFTNLSINKIGTAYTLVASTSPTLTTLASSTFDITLGPLSQLGITSVNGGVNPTAGIPFAVAVQSQDAGGNPVTLGGDIGFTLGVGTGTGTLGGTLAGTIASGASSKTMSGITYTKAESGVTLVGTQTSGTPALTGVPSSSFTVISGAATKLAVTTINGGVLNPVETVAFPVVVQSQDANGNPANVVASTAVSLSRASGTGSLGGVVTGTIAAGASAVTVSGVTYSKGETGVTLTATRTSGDTLSAGTSAAFTVNAFATPGTELITNGDFSLAVAPSSWKVFEEPDINYGVVGGVFQFFKASPTTTASGVASVYQETNRALPLGAPVLAQFDLGNSTTVRKRISVVMADADMTDLGACSFELPAGAQKQTYKMLAHTTRLVTNATLRFYAEDGGANGGNYLLDNVSLKYVPSQSNLFTACVDPTRPAAPSGTDSTTNLLTNGDFGTGTLAAWSVAGNISLQLTAGVLEFIRPTASTPAAVVLQTADVVSQSTGLSMTAGQLFTATIQLGNSSTVRKRVTLRIGEADLSDQTACTFWVPPSQTLLTYTMRGFASIAWTNATLAIYPETAGPESWIQFDNATLRRTGNYPTAGVECMEPVPGVLGGIAAPGLAAYDPAFAAPLAAPSVVDALDSASTDWLGAGAFTLASDASSSGAGVGWRAEAWASGRATLLWAQAIDLTAATSAHVSLQSWLSAGAAAPSSGLVQVSVDGVTWQTVTFVPRTDAWTPVDVDLGAFLGRMVYLRFVFDGVAPGDGVMPDIWRIDDVFVTIVGRRWQIP